MFGYIEEVNKTKEPTEIRSQGTENHKIDSKKVNNLIHKTDWNGIINTSGNTNELFNNIYKVFCNIYDKSTEENIKKKK